MAVQRGATRSSRGRRRGRRLLLRGLSRGVNTSCETITLPLLPCAAWFVGRLLG